MPALAPATVANGPMDGGRRSGTSVKTLKRMLKKAGLKVSGKKATLTRRVKKARLMGGADEEAATPMAPPTAPPMEPLGEEEKKDGGRKRRRGSRKGLGFPRLY